jgi:hypothetical protein
MDCKAYMYVDIVECEHKPKGEVNKFVYVKGYITWCFCISLGEINKTREK